MNSTFLESLASHPMVFCLGWTLVHFVWQATVLALLTAVTLQFAKNASTTIRYAVSCAGMAAMVALPIGTLACLISTVPARDWNQSANPVVATNTSDTALESEWTSGKDIFDIHGEDASSLGDDSISQSGEDLMSDDAIVQLSFFQGVDQRLKGWLPWCVAGWIAGVLLLALRLLFGLRRVNQWRNESKPIGLEHLNQCLARLTKRMNVRKHVRLLESARATVPAVMGWLRPVILVPTSMISGLTTGELESLLAHELAHIRRHDYLINLLQNIVETVLFYHPAVWWVSRRIRIEREHCCDDLAVAVCGDRVSFVRALARMEEIRCDNDQLAVAANGGSLIGRIRRLTSRETPQTSSWWPAGAIAIGAIATLFVGLWASDVTANSDRVDHTNMTEEIEPEVTIESVEETSKDEDYATQKDEVEKKDTKTGQVKRVFTGIKLVSDANNEIKRSSLDMMYSNVITYTFIPARIAKELGAVELGEIDFGDRPPPKKQLVQPLKIQLEGLVGNNESAKPEKPEKPNVKTTTVDQLIEPAGDTKVIPYEDDVLWVPGHLGFYGVNQTKQQVFKIVRISSVDLGIGPSFGPINALVLDNANSDFGVLGRHWGRQVRGKNGETLWHAAVGGFHLMNGPKSKAPLPKLKDKANEKTNEDKPAMKVASTGHPFVDPKTARHAGGDVKVLKTHTYNRSRRESKDWIELKGSKVPVDDGVEHDGLIVYMTLFNDIVAVNAEDKKVVWEYPWFKTMPFWQTVSIVEVMVGNEKTIAVELFAPKSKSGEVVYRYASLATGKLIEPTLTKQHHDPGNDSNPPDSKNDLPKIKISEKDGEQITQAFASANKDGRTAVDLLLHFSQIFDRHGSPERAGSVVNMESIVSAFPRYLLGNAMDADLVYFSLPEGSETRAVFSGEKVEISKGDKSVEIVITNGKLKLLDSVGVTRATATADGGAEQLIVVCQMKNDEVEMEIRTRRLVEIAEPNPPVQVIMNTETGAPKNEEDPPHRAVRYSIFPESKSEEKPVRMKMKWRYDFRRLAEEAEAQSGKTWEQLLYGDDIEDKTKVE